MRLLITAILTVVNYLGLNALMHIYGLQMVPPLVVLLALILAVAEMVIIVIPVGNWLGITDDGGAGDGGDW